MGWRAAVGLVASALGCGGLAAGLTAATAAGHGDPDPGGHRMAVVRTVEHAVPPHVDVLSDQVTAPRWDSCDGRAGTHGWDDLTLYVDFRTDAPADAVVASTDAALTAAGWTRVGAEQTPLGRSITWSHVVPGGDGALAGLARGVGGHGDAPYWSLSADAPPHSRRASGC